MRNWWARRGRWLVLVLVTVLTAGTSLGESLEHRGDRAFSQRSDGFLETDLPNAEAVERAIAAYEEALANEPKNVDLHVKLMDALYFQGYYVLEDRRLQREIFDRVVALATQAVELVGEEAGAGSRLAEQTPEQQAAALQEIPGAAAAHFWSAKGWGLWGVTHHPLSAVRKGVAGRVRKHSEIARLLNEEYEDAGGLRFLGQLHAAAPRVPLITGWVDRPLGLRLLRRAVDLSRNDPRNLWFLAEAILEHDEEHRNEALALLRELDRECPHAEELVEHTETLVLARQRLVELGED